MKKHIPLGNYVLIEVHKGESSSRGLDIPESDRNKPQTATIIRVPRNETLFEDGDEITFDKFASKMEVKEGDKTYFLLQTTKIYSILQ